MKQITLERLKYRCSVLNLTGFYTDKDKAQAHIEAGAKKVLISAPAAFKNNRIQH